MLQALVRHAKAFHLVGADPETITVSASSDPQKLPDWVRGTNTWKYGLQDGTIVEINPVVLKEIERNQAPRPPQSDVKVGVDSGASATFGPPITEDGQPVRRPTAVKARRNAPPPPERPANPNAIA